jgi:branched-chain amino acid transport system substrate-binding protein
MKRLLFAVFLLLGHSFALANEFVVGVSVPLSGPGGAMGPSFRNGIELALEQAEDGGRFRDNVQLSLRAIDDAGPDGVDRLVRFVSEEEAILVVGPVYSVPAVAAAAYANRLGFPILTPAVSEGVNRAGPWSFRVSPGPRELLEYFAHYLVRERSPAKVVVVYAAANAGYRAQAGYLTAVFGEAVAREAPVAAGETAIEALAATLAGEAPDLVVVCLDPEVAGSFARSLRGLPGGAAPQLAFVPAAAQPSLLRTGGMGVEGALLAVDYLPELPGAQNAAFVEAYRARYARMPDRYAGLGYATGLVAVEAIVKTGPAPGRQTVRVALERILSLPLPLGQSDWQVDGYRNPHFSPAIFTVQDGRFVPLLPKPQVPPP